MLSELCVKLGFCLPADETDRLAASPPDTVDGFLAAVLVSEGYGVPSQDGVVRQAREMVAAAFMRHKSTTTAGQ